eukprot:scaffold43284_cov18-Tisochrysis_lutea.AAC.2
MHYAGGGGSGRGSRFFERMCRRTSVSVDVGSVLLPTSFLLFKHQKFEVCALFNVKDIPQDNPLDKLKFASTAAQQFEPFLFLPSSTPGKMVRTHFMRPWAEAPIRLRLPAAVPDELPPAPPASRRREALRSI